MSDRYELRDKDEQLAALAAAVRHMQPSKKGGKTIGEQEAAEARHRERQTVLHLTQVWARRIGCAVKSAWLSVYWHEPLRSPQRAHHQNMVRWRRWRASWRRCDISRRW